MNKPRKALIYLTAAALLMSGFTGCKQAAESKDSPAGQTVVSLKMDDSSFSDYKEVPVNVTPSLKPYQASKGLSNIINKDQFVFSDEAQNLLIKNGFVVVPDMSREFFWTYEANRYEPVPSFVTTDAMLHNYHLYFSYLLRTLEKDHLRSELVSLTSSMLKKSQKQYDSLKGTEWETAAKRNVAYFSVAAGLLDPDSEAPSYVKTEVESELALINAHQQTAPSPVMNMGAATDDPAAVLKEDYTQYIPRGHYARSEDLKTYFRTMMWYGRLTFRASSEDETRSAALITLLLNDQKDYDHWNNIYAPTNFFVGKSDDLGFSQYYDLIRKTYGEVPALDSLIADVKKWSVFRTELDKLKAPALNSIPIYNKEIQPDRDQAVKGFRFMGQRFTLDAQIFQRLVYRDVEENGSGELRMLPKGLDIPAAMGSEAAYEILKDMGETNYKNYPENMEKLQGTITTLDKDAWTQNLYWSWLYTLNPLTEPKGEGYPSFMQNSAWTNKQLETYLGSWTELKHNTILYAKQTYAEMGGGGEDPVDDRGYVEPNPEVYARLAALTRMTIDGLSSRGMVSKTTLTPLNELEQLALSLKTISEKELVGKTLSDDEYELIRSFGGQLEHFWLEALKDQGVDDISLAADNPASLIADVATDPNGQVLEEGTGNVNNIFVIVPVSGTLRIAKGTVYSYYEFPWPANDRLTDEKWRIMVQDYENSSQMPEAPSWTKAYTAAEGASQW
jgi:hypothetical protein